MYLCRQRPRHLDRLKCILLIRFRLFSLSCRVNPSVLETCFSPSISEEILEVPCGLSGDLEMHQPDTVRVFPFPNGAKWLFQLLGGKPMSESGMRIWSEFSVHSDQGSFHIQEPLDCHLGAGTKTSGKEYIYFVL